MAKIIEAFMKDVLDQYNREEISFSRMCEIINDKANESSQIETLSSDWEKEFRKWLKAKWCPTHEQMIEWIKLQFKQPVEQLTDEMISDMASLQVSRYLKAKNDPSVDLHRRFRDMAKWARDQNNKSK